MSPASASRDIEGFGYATLGGKGGSTCHVTSLAASGAGSLLDCVLEREGPRIVVFDVAGTVVPEDTLRINDPYLTIDGTTAPPPGITIRPPNGGAKSALVVESTHDVIIRGLRLVGYATGGDGDLIGLDGTEGDAVYNVVVDHLALTQADDGALDITGNVHDITVSWCLLYGNILTSLIKYDTRQRFSIHHSVYAHNAERNPQVKGDMRTLDFRNNILHDWTLTREGYGLLLWSAPAGSDSPGVPSVNLVGNAFLAKAGSNDCGLVLKEDAAPVQRWLSDNMALPSPLCASSNLPAPLPIPGPAQVSTAPASSLASLLLPEVGVHPRTPAEQALLDEIAARLK
ncbi:MAG TPA: hypothetical protein VEQ10_06940 [Vicinamibacteria bacterium]|nr:hypothetical protein [Vicinamibacteria bacterium]